MVRLNKDQLDDGQLEVLFTQFAQLLNSSNTHTTNQIVYEILGHEERIMLAKRIAIIVLLIEGYSLYEIALKLKVSPATAQKIRHNLEQGDYQSVRRRLGKSKKDYFAFLDVLDNILHLGGILPHYNGMDRYKHIR